MVGAGGIGCELLKNLVLTQYGEIHIVDLDTITLSNLNRQFLFRPKDIDKSKSLTVVKAVEEFNYHNSKLIPHHGNIMDTEQFPMSWWNQFNYVFNALDNLEARRYVNKMCLFLKKPLMESGTTGYDGQVQPIFPNYSECFECQAKATPKTFPVCTIRSTPSQPVHCITWAKEFLFCQLFDEVSPSTTSGSNEEQRKKLESETDDKQEIENMVTETNELNGLRQLIKDPSLTKRQEFIKHMIIKIFKVDIERLLLIDSLWKSRTKPIPLEYDEEFSGELHELLSHNDNESILKKDTQIWSILENLYVLHKSSESLQRRLNESEPFIPFDKDDEDTLNFVVAAANLRSSIFHIETKSKFDIKQIAGNIIPAIATTNAIISGFSCLESLDYFKDVNPTKDFSRVMKDASTVFVSIRPNKYITSASLVEPASQCPNCSLSRGLLNINNNDLASWTLQDLVDRLVAKYKYGEDISVILGNSKLIYDVDFDDNLSTKLNEVNGFKNGELLLIQDDTDQLDNLELYINIDDSESQFPHIVLGQKQKIEHASQNDDNNISNIEPTNKDTIIVEDQDEGLVDINFPASKKRKAEQAETNGKKLKS